MGAWKAGLAGFFTVLVIAGCAGPRVEPLSDAVYAPQVAPEQVRLYVGDISRPYREVAWIDSVSATTRHRDARRDQLTQIRRKAAELGADAVIEIRSLEEQRRGLTSDPRAPVPAWQQSRTTMYFLRGKAVRLLDTGDQPVLEREEELAGMQLDPDEPGPIPQDGLADNIPETSAPSQPTPPTGAPRPGY
ncbi:MAG: hypothetical protein KF858_12390 [Candidatus Sumerlaeia bacterium]|nr:hypothetical protein [Candidatus Sumerlaeia bacterium]